MGGEAAPAEQVMNRASWARASLRTPKGAPPDSLPHRSPVVGKHVCCTGRDGEGGGESLAGAPWLLHALKPWLGMCSHNRQGQRALSYGAASPKRCEEWWVSKGSCSSCLVAGCSTLSLSLTTYQSDAGCCCMAGMAAEAEAAVCSTDLEVARALTAWQAKGASTRQRVRPAPGSGEARLDSIAMRWCRKIGAALGVGVCGKVSFQLACQTLSRLCAWRGTANAGGIE